MEITDDLSPEDIGIAQAEAACALSWAYHDIVAQPPPDNIVALLDQLAAQE